MLFNPLWQETTTDPFELATLIAWLERRVPVQKYDYKSCQRCLLGQYFSSHYQRVDVSKNLVSYQSDEAFEALLGIKQMRMLPPYFDWIASSEPHTFGAALERAKRVQSEPHEVDREMWTPW